MGKINSRAKGAQAEREVAKIFTACGFPARRGQQFSGIGESPDVVCDSLTNIHIEVKRVEMLNIEAAYQQATRDAKGKVPIVIHRKKGEKWKVTLSLSDFLGIFIKPHLTYYSGMQTSLVGDRIGAILAISEAHKVNLNE